MLRRFSILLVIAIGAAACSGGDGGNDGPSAEPSPSSDDPAVAVDEPVEGGVLRIGMARPSTLDPAGLSPGSASELLLADLMFDGLTRLGADGLAEPSLATFKPDAKLTTWTFSLSGGDFAEGRALTAADAKSSLERMAVPGTASFAGLRLEIVNGYKAFVDGKAAEISGITATDNTLVIKLSRPMATLPELLASPIYGIVAAETFNTSDPVVTPTPLGSGSFVIVESGDDLVRLERRTDAAGFVEGIDIQFFDDEAEAYAAFDAGDLDWAPVPPETVGDAAAKYGEEGFVPFQAVLFFGFNLGKEHLQNRKFREAIAQAVDRDAIVEAVYGESAVPLAQVVPSGVAGAAEAPCANRCDHDPEQAAKLVTEVFPDGNVPVVSVDVDDSDRLGEVAGIIKENLDAIGVPVVINSLPFKEYQEFAVSGDQELFSFGWVNLYPSAEATLDPLFRSDSLDNVTGFVVPQFDFVIGEARTKTDVAERVTLLAEAEAIAMSRAPVVPIAQFRTLTVTSERVHDLAVGLDGSFDASLVWLEPGD